VSQSSNPPGCLQLEKGSAANLKAAEFLGLVQLLAIVIREVVEVLIFRVEVNRKANKALKNNEFLDRRKPGFVLDVDY